MAPGEGRGQAHLIEQLADPAVALGPRHLGVDPERLAHARADGRQGVEGGVGVLEDQLHPAAQRPQVRSLGLGDVVAPEQHPAGRRYQQTEQQAGDRRLARAALADQAEGLSFGHGQVYAVHGVDRALAPAREANREVARDADERGHGNLRRHRRRRLWHGGRHGVRTECHETGLGWASPTPGQDELALAQAAAEAIGAERLHGDHLARTALLGELAAGVEATARGELPALGDLPGDQGGATRLGPHPGGGGQQSGRVGVGRMGEQFGCRRLLDHLAGVHHGDLVGELGDEGEVVGDEEHGQALLFAQLVEELDDLGLDRHVEGGGRLVGDEQARLAAQRHGDHDPLAHAARELVGVGAEPLGGVGDVHALQQGRRPAPERPSRLTRS